MNSSSRRRYTPLPLIQSTSSQHIASSARSTSSSSSFSSSSSSSFAFDPQQQPQQGVHPQQPQNTNWRVLREQQQPQQQAQSMQAHQNFIPTAFPSSSSAAAASPASTAVNNLNASNYNQQPAIKQHHVYSQQRQAGTSFSGTAASAAATTSSSSSFKTGVPLTFPQLPMQQRPLPPQQLSQPLPQRQYQQQPQQVQQRQLNPLPPRTQPQQQQVLGQRFIEVDLLPDRSGGWAFIHTGSGAGVWSYYPERWSESSSSELIQEEDERILAPNGRLMPFLAALADYGYDMHMSMIKLNESVNQREKRSKKPPPHILFRPPQYDLQSFWLSSCRDTPWQLDCDSYGVTSSLSLIDEKGRITVDRLALVKVKKNESLFSLHMQLKLDGTHRKQMKLVIFKALIQHERGNKKEQQQQQPQEYSNDELDVESDRMCLIDVDEEEEKTFKQKQCKEVKEGLVRYDHDLLSYFNKLMPMDLIFEKVNELPIPQLPSRFYPKSMRCGKVNAAAASVGGIGRGGMMQLKKGKPLFTEKEFELANHGMVRANY